MLPMPAAPDESYQNVPAIAVVSIARDHELIDDKGNYKEVHFIEWAKKGSNGATTRDKAERLKKDLILWPVIEPVYERWLKGQEEPESGTPLSAWPGVTKGQAEQLKMLHIRSVEDLAKVTDNDLERIGMGARALREKARAFMQAKEGQSVIAEELSKRDEQIDELKRQMADLMEANKGLQAAVGQKRGPGRPPKNVAEG